MKNNLVAGAISGVMCLLVVVLGLTIIKPTVVVNAVTEAFGNASSPALVDGCLNVNGHLQCAFRTEMKAASTTCSFKSTASSTLMYAAVHFANLQGGAFQVEFGKSNDVMATTTSLGTGNALAGTPTVVASSSPVNGGDTMSQFFNAGQLLNIKISSSTVSSGLKGTCDAVFWQI